MYKFLLGLVAVMMLFLVGCASGGGASMSDNSGLPEVAAYDDEPFDALADNVPAE